MDRAKGRGVNFWACDVPVEDRTPVVFKNIDDFISNAKIDGVLVKDLWDDVEEPGTLM